MHTAANQISIWENMSVRLFWKSNPGPNSIDSLHVQTFQELNWQETICQMTSLWQWMTRRRRVEALSQIWSFVQEINIDAHLIKKSDFVQVSIHSCEESCMVFLCRRLLFCCTCRACWAKSCQFIDASPKKVCRGPVMRAALSQVQLFVVQLHSQLPKWSTDSMCSKHCHL